MKKLIFGLSIVTAATLAVYGITLNAETGDAIYIKSEAPAAMQWYNNTCFAYVALEVNPGMTIANVREFSCARSNETAALGCEITERTVFTAAQYLAALAAGSIQIGDAITGTANAITMDRRYPRVELTAAQVVALGECIEGVAGWEAVTGSNVFALNLRVAGSAVTGELYWIKSAAPTVFTQDRFDGRVVRLLSVEP